MSSLLPRALLTVGAFWGVHAANTMQKWNGAIPALPGSITTVGQGWIDTMLSYVGMGPKPSDKR